MSIFSPEMIAAIVAIVTAVGIVIQRLTTLVKLLRHNTALTEDIHDNTVLDPSIDETH